MRLAALVTLAACAAGPGPGAHAPTSAAAGKPADRPPSPIAGAWRMGCPEDVGMVVEFVVDQRKAVGRIVEPGAATKYGYKKGEEMFHLAADAHGDWVGEVRWRGVSGTQHWDGIRMVAQASALTATMTNDGCYKTMAKVR